MSHAELNEDQIRDIVRDIDAGATRTPSPAVWERVEAGLPATTAGPTKTTRPQLRVVHRANRGRMRTLLAVAACLLAVFGLTWFYTSAPGDGVVLSEVDIQRSVERTQLDGPLELDGESTPLRRSVYDGVAVKVGDLGTDALQVCVAC